MKDGRLKNSILNMSTGMIYQVLMFVLSFVSRTVFIRTLGNEFLGMNAIFTDVMSLLSMADLGFGTAMAYSFYEPLAKKDYKKLSALVRFYRKVYLTIAITVLGVGLACIPFLKYIINTDKEIPNLTIYYLFSLAGIVISYLFVYKTTLLTADQKGYEISKIRMVTAILKTILQIVVLVVAKSYIMYLFIGVVVQFLDNVIASAKTTKTYPFLKEYDKNVVVDKNLGKGIFNNLQAVFINKFSNTMFSATSNVIISMVVGTVAAGLYSNYVMISNKLLLIQQIIFSALTPSVGNVIVKENEEKRLQIFEAMQSVSFIFCGIISSAFYLLVNDLMLVWLGEEYVLPMAATIAITANRYLTCTIIPLWIYKDATGLYTKTKYVMLIGAILNIVLSFALGYTFGITGVIMASVIARILTYYWYEPMILYREYFSCSAKKYFLENMVNVVLVIVTIFALDKITAKIVVNSWMTLIQKGLIVGIICFVVFLLFYSRTEGFKLIRNKIMNLIKVRKN